MHNQSYVITFIFESTCCVHVYVCSPAIKSIEVTLPVFQSKGGLCLFGPISDHEQLLQTTKQKQKNFRSFTTFAFLNKYFFLIKSF